MRVYIQESLPLEADVKSEKCMYRHHLLTRPGGSTISIRHVVDEECSTSSMQLMGKDLLNLRGRLRLMVRESATPSLFKSSSRLRITGTLTFKFEEITEVCFCHSKETETYVFLLKMQVTHPFPKKRGEPRQG